MRFAHVLTASVTIVAAATAACSTTEPANHGEDSQSGRAEVRAGGRISEELRSYIQQHRGSDGGVYATEVENITTPSLLYTGTLMLLKNAAGESQSNIVLTGDQWDAATADLMGVAQDHAIKIQQYDYVAEAATVTADTLPQVCDKAIAELTAAGVEVSAALLLPVARQCLPGAGSVGGSGGAANSPTNSSAGATETGATATPTSTTTPTSTASAAGAPLRKAYSNLHRLNTFHDQYLRQQLHSTLNLSGKKPVLTARADCATTSPGADAWAVLSAVQQGHTVPAKKLASCRAAAKNVLKSPVAESPIDQYYVALAISQGLLDVESTRLQHKLDHVAALGEVDGLVPEPVDRLSDLSTTSAVADYVADTDPDIIDSAMIDYLIAGVGEENTMLEGRIAACATLAALKQGETVQQQCAKLSGHLNDVQVLAGLSQPMVTFAAVTAQGHPLPEEISGDLPEAATIEAAHVLAAMHRLGLAADPEWAIAVQQHTEELVTTTGDVSVVLVPMLIDLWDGADNLPPDVRTLIDDALNHAEGCNDVPELPAFAANSEECSLRHIGLKPFIVRELRN